MPPRSCAFDDDDDKTVARDRFQSVTRAIGEKRARSAWNNVHQAADRVDVDRR